MDNRVVGQRDVLVKAEGTDGVQYVVRLMVWDLATIEKYWDKFKPYKILSDDIPATRAGFERFVLTSGALWYEIVEETTEADVGLMYIADFVSSFTESRFLSASFHVSMWDSKIGTRMPVLKLAVRELFHRFKLHRLEMEIPLFAGGAIRIAKKSGFVEEGVRRQARRYNGQWWNILHLAMLETEVP
jgi:hypothetical protein